MFPKTDMIGCALHWTRAIYRRLKKIGLNRLYKSNAEVASLLGTVMCLSLIPQEQFLVMFKK